MKPLLTLAFVGAALMGSVPAAQADGLVFDPSASLNCANRAFADGPVGLSAARACITVSSERCMMDTPGGNSTVGMAGCAARGHEMWDAELNRVYRILRRQEDAISARNREISENLPSPGDSLREMQRAWITFRDTRCTYEAAQWGGGTGAGPAYAACLELMTGEQTLFLRSLLHE